MHTDQLDVLHELLQEGLVVASPPTDDDDAYVLTIAQRENARRNLQPHGVASGAGYVLSNDLFRDAQARDTTGTLKQWLNEGLPSTTGSSNSGHGALGIDGPGRISFAFGDMGRIDDHGEKELDFIPNPRHPLVAWIEQQMQLMARGP